MKIRGSGGSGDKIEVQMAPMIDVVFQLLIFFMLTLKIIEPEGDFNINMPIAAPSEATPQDTPPVDIKVRMVANPDGTLGQLALNQRSLGSGEDAFQRLNSEIATMVGSSGNPLFKDVEVEIDADYDLHYENVIRAVSSVTGRRRADGTIMRFIEKVKFAPAREGGA